MSISKDLFLAILAMDSYNRGYNAGIKSPTASDREGLVGTRIGNAELLSRSNIDAASNEVAASFFAQAYTLNGSYGASGATPGLTSGQTVISYRGTDNRMP